MIVWVLNIEHRHGNDAFVYESKEDAKQHVIDYVADWWDDEKERAFDSETWGENPGGWESVEKYFDQVEGEYWSIQDTTLIAASR